MTNFHNPYNFVPALPRDSVSGCLGDGEPVGHHAYLEDRWSGTISVKLITKTPLLIPDASTAKDEDGHKTYDLRTLGDQPDLPLTSVKGMLRSAYEAITNSRLSVFVNHDERLAYRMATKMGIRMVPARIEGGRIRLFPGNSDTGIDGSPQGAMYAAWLPRYSRGRTSLDAVKYSDRSLPQHGEKVKAYVELIQHKRWDKRQSCHVPDFQYLRVLEIARDGNSLEKKKLSPVTTPRNGCSYHQPLKKCIEITGYVCISNANIDRKHDERVFFDVVDEALTVALTPKLKQQWNQLITNYQEEHQAEICEKKRTSPPALNWSRHITHNPHRLAEEERNLTEGTLCYALVDNSGKDLGVTGLYPVMISRELFDYAPDRLLHNTLSPAKELKYLSPADRVFGWVRQNNKGTAESKDKVSAYKGQLRVHAMECISSDPIHFFENDGFPLAILGQPKPQQARFYAAKNKQGDALDNGTVKQQGYQQSQGLRGRKVYPHHQGLPEGYWNQPERDRTQQETQGHYQEYRRPKKDGQEQRDNQNRSIKAWVKPDSEFRFKLDVVNLSDVELGALLYLLSLPPDHYHRLGGGKPLRFGSVRLEWDACQTDLRKGQDWRKFYSSLLPVQRADVESEQTDLNRTIAEYRKAVATGYKKAFEKVPFIAAFEKSALGYSNPVHYPRTTLQPLPEGESFKWFVENGAQPRGQRLALPDLTSDRLLPINPTTEQSSSTRRRP